MTVKHTENSTETAQQVATQPDVLPLDDLSLLGTFSDGENHRALLRRSTGRVLTVEIGNRIGAEVLVAIEDGSIILANGVETRRLNVA